MPVTTDLATAVEWLSGGGVVVFPTDTVYGVAVDPRSDAAIETLFDVKGRDPSVAVPLIAASPDQAAAALGPFSPDTRRLAEAFWPGPLSLIVDAPAVVSRSVHGGRGTVAVRVPNQPIACGLAAGLGFPITATSANRSGAPAVSRPGDLDAIAHDPRVLVLDGGPAPGGPPSTIVDARHRPAALVRAGAIGWDRVLPFLHG